MAHLHLLAVWPIASLANALTTALVNAGEANLQVKAEQLIPIVVGGAVNPLMTVMVLAATITAVLVIFWSIVRHGYPGIEPAAFAQLTRFNAGRRRQIWVHVGSWQDSALADLDTAAAR